MGQCWLHRFAAVVVLCLWPLAALAQDVALTSRDGTLSFSGTLQGFDGAFFRVMTEYGALTVDAQGVTCQGPGCPDLLSRFDEIRVVGEADLAERLLPALFRAFAEARGNRMIRRVDDGVPLITLIDAQEAPVARIRFTAMAPGAALQALRSGSADLGLSPLAEPALNARVLGQEALIVAVAPDNPLTAITTRDLAQVLAGRVVNWSELGGPDMPLVVHAPGPETGYRRAVEARLGQNLSTGLRHDRLADLAAAVARDPYALAVTTETARGAARALPLVDSCGFGLQPGRAAVKAEDYPLALPVFALTAKRRLPLILRDFVEFLATPAAQAAVVQAGLIDRAPERVGLIADGQRLANAIRAEGSDMAELQRLTAAMAGAERLTLSFRFRDGARGLDAASQGNLQDLVRLIDAGVFAGDQMMFVGFSDGVGDASDNLALSRQRADLVRAAVAAGVADLTASRTALLVEAFGEALPMACDENPVGRQINRRVEVWLRPLTTPEAAAYR